LPSAFRLFVCYLLSLLMVLSLPVLARTGTQSSDQPPQDSLRQETRQGRWYRSRTRTPQPLTPEQAAEIRRLESLGYVSGSTAPRTETTITIHDPERAWAGFNFHTTGRAAEAFLRDMDGTILHHWHHSFHEVWPQRQIESGKQHWRRAYLYENGDVLAIFEGEGIIKIDKDSRLIWANPTRAHHDMCVMPDGDIYTLTRQAHVIPRLDPQQPILEDFITLLGPDGIEKRSVSLIECYENSDFEPPWREWRYVAGDIFHTNTVEVLDGRFAQLAPWLQEGYILTSIRELNLIAVVDFDRERLVMTQAGTFRAQHDPRLLDNGNLLLFDNKGAGYHSRVLELDPRTMEIVWQYQGTKESPFYTDCCGLSQRLPNGNTLIVESTAGRAFEVTVDKEIVWEFYNPDRAGDQGRYIAALMELVRLAPDFPLAWAQHQTTNR
jgi:hypothetical protein